MNRINYYKNIYTCKKKDKTEHTVTTDELIERVKPFFKTMGFVRFGDITDFDRIGIPVVNAVRPFSKGLSISHGKGLTIEGAVASALMESVERFHASSANIEYFKCNYNMLDKEKRIPVDKIALMKNSIFHPDNQELWTEAWDIVKNREIFVPSTLISMKDRKDDLDSFFKCSNGLAASVDFLEAVSQALFEVIERDATTNSYMKNRSKGIPYLTTRVKPETIKFETVKELLNLIEKADIYWVLYDQTIDTDIPTYECQLIDMKEKDFILCKGMGTSLKPERSMTRAITEAVQARAVALSGVREPFFKSEMYFIHLNNNESYLKLLEENSHWEWVDAEAHKSVATESFEEDIDICIKKLKNIGLESVIVKDLTMENCNFKVVRVIVPGLEGVDDLIHYAPGKRAKEFLKGKSV